MNFKEWLKIESSRWKLSKWKRPPVNVIQRLKKYNKPNFYCHFTDVKDKIGIKPENIHDTPYGIYAYTIPYALEYKVKNLPYASEREYVWVFKAKNPQRIRKIKDRRDKNGQIYVKVNNIAKSYSDMSLTFLKMGIHGFVDEGTATIHPSEPYQAVFFGSQTISPVDFFLNDMQFEEPDDEVSGHFYGKDEDSQDDDDDDWDDPFQTAYGKSPWGSK